MNACRIPIFFITAPHPLTPVKTGVQIDKLDSRFRGNERKVGLIVRGVFILVVDLQQLVGDLA
jgi:hypothetical protein